MPSFQIKPKKLRKKFIIANQVTLFFGKRVV
jgi:hypothetical protein